MSAAGFTPGPWSIHGKRPVEVWNEGGDILVADCTDHAGSRAMGPPEASRAEAHANARLIAAAPALLAVARAVCMFHGVADWNEGVAAQWRSLTDEPATTKGLCNFARAAIVKAVVR